MAPKIYQEEARIQHYLRTTKKPHKNNIRAVAEANKVGYRKLLNRVNGVSSKIGRKPTNRKLSDDQDAILCRYINRLSEYNLFPTRSIIRNVANNLLAQSVPEDATAEDPAESDPAVASPPSPPIVSEMWVGRWLKRHPEFIKKKTRNLEADRLIAQNYSVIATWYRDYAKVVDRLAVGPADIWNIDHTGFQVGIGGGETIICPKHMKKADLPAQLNRQHVTVIETASAVGETIEPMVVLKGKIHQAGRARTAFAQGDGAINMTESGYATDETMLDFISHFEHQTRGKRQGAWRLLLLDNYDCSKTYEFLEYCEQHKIYPFFLPSHMTHLMQPLDVTVFQQEKHYHKAAVNAAVRAGITTFTVNDFLEELPEIRRQTFKINTIIRGFENSGIWPVNAAAVLTKIADTDPDRPSTPPSANPDEVPTPHTSRRYFKLGIQRKISVERRNDILQKMLKAGRIAIQERGVLQQQLDNVLNQQRKRAKNAKIPGDQRVIQSGGSMDNQALRYAVTERDKKEAEVAAKRAKREVLEYAKAPEKRA